MRQDSILSTLSLCWKPLLLTVGLLWPSACLPAGEPNGAPNFGNLGEATTEIDEAQITEDDRDHWAWQPLHRPPLPPVRQAAWCQNEIDRFILHELEQKQLAPRQPASAERLLRRLKFDLQGLPPTLEELGRAPRSPADVARLVERLLASPAYGEHWAQFWLDLARFAETDGFEHDKVRDGAWKYRDWVIQAFNAGLPYDQFLRQQIAGDLQPGGQPIATQFVLAGPDMPDINEQDLRRHDKLNELTSTVGAVVLGLQLHCAQCHDHKYDAISQADFYRFRAIFEAAVPQMKRDQHVLTLARDPDAAPGRFYHRGELGGVGGAVPPGVPRITVPANQRFQLGAESPRQELCDRLFDDRHPLTARVIANRVWQAHFGQSLIENPSDLGVVAGGPSHPQLLDWLASELVHSGWDLKHLHRKILFSATYQQEGGFQTGTEDEGEVSLLTHFPRKRLTGEAIRDAILAVSGQLDQRTGGPSVRPPLPPELVGTLLKGQWKTSPSEADHARRSIYVFARRNLRYPIFDAFDRPDAGASCPRRNRSTTAIQSLHLLNSEFTHSAAQATAIRLLRSTPTETGSADLVDALFRMSLSRSAQPAERQLLLDYLGPRSNLSEEDLQARLTILALAIFNSNEFLYID